MRERAPDGPHVAHDVQLPIRIPLVVSDLLEARLPCDTDVVDEDVEAADGFDGNLDDPLRFARQGEICDDVGLLPHVRWRPSTAGDDARTFFDELPHDGEPDPGGRAG